MENKKENRMKTRLKARALRIWIARNNITQQEFAEKVGISNGYLTQMVTGRKYPTGKVRTMIQGVTGLGWDDLFEIVEIEA